MRRLTWLLALLVVLIVVLVWYCRPKPPGVVTALELESYGGFAYIQPPGANELSISFLKDYKKDEPDPANPTGPPVTVCEVDQLGVDLLVISGAIASVSKGPNLAPIPANRTFDLAGAVVTFPDLSKSSQALVVNRGDRPTGPFGPADPNNESHWLDLKWVPGTSYAASARSAPPNYPASTLNPNWPSLIDGRVVLTRGTITAAHPSDVAIKDSIFEFRSKSGARNPFKQAVTDTTQFKADVPSDQIVINLTGAASGITQIVVKPSKPGRPVRLKLKGRHVHQTKPELPLDAGIDHFCAFYQLLQPVPDFKDQLIPHRVAGPTIASAGFSGQPSPGPFCPGDWYPE
jgi:hypothetical protein